MIRELQILDRECSKANNCTVLRRDLKMFGRDFYKDGTTFLRDAEKTATKTKRNDVILVALIKD